MSENNQLTQSELSRIADGPIPLADDVAGRFQLSPNPNPASDEQRARELTDLKFGQVFTDHMAHARWTSQDGWSDFEIIPYGNLSLSPAACVLHYSQEIFEGLKAYRHAGGSVQTFRPLYNAARINASARRLAMPELPVEDFLASLVDLVRADEKWVPSSEGATLYLRPFMIATEAYLGVHPSNVVDFYVIASPSGPYFANGFSPVSIWVSRDYHRAGRGGTGAAKTGGNYAASLMPQMQAAEKGYDQVCYLDDVTESKLEELGGMNVFVVGADGVIRTPRLGTILEGCTRSAIIRLLSTQGYEVREEDIILDDLVAQIEAGEVSEMFACGTAAVVTPIGKLGSDNFAVELGTGPVTTSVYEQLTAIQFGQAEDTFNWLYKLS